MALERVLKGGEQAGNRGGENAFAGNAIREALGGRAGRRPPGAVEAGDRPRLGIADQHVDVTRQGHGVGRDDSEDQAGGDGGIHGIAAVLQHAQGRPGWPSGWPAATTP